MCAFVVLGLVFPYQTKRLPWGTSPKWPILCRVWCKTTTQSVSSANYAPLVWCWALVTNLRPYARELLSLLLTPISSSFVERLWSMACAPTSVLCVKWDIAHTARALLVCLLKA